MPRSRPTTLVLMIALASACTLFRASSERPSAKPEPAAQRVTTSGAVIGTRGRYGGFAWLGVPYAKAPVGSLRWRAPEPPDPWGGTRETIRFAPPCPQLATPFGGINDVSQGKPTGSEDCLYLNVWAPEAAGSSRLPVMVWIHGGGNSVGHGGFYDGSNLASSQNVVVLTLNYRLGPLGWFHHVALAEPGTTPAERSGNFTTLDLVRALTWVRDNAAAFGGDPGNVTIFGESAGGTNVATLLATPLARGLFHRAIMQSSGLRAVSLDEAEHLSDDPLPGHRHSANELLLALFQRDGTAKDRNAAKARLSAITADEIARYLRSKTAEDLLAVAAPGNFGGILDIPTVFRDGVVLPSEGPFTVERWSAVPIMLGTNRDENKIFLFTDPAYVRRWFGFFPVLEDRRRYELSALYGSRMWKAGAADGIAMRLAANRRPAFVYRWDWDEEPKLPGADIAWLLGASHGFEIPFVFGHWDLGREGNRLWTVENEPGRRALSAAMMSYWTSFAYTGDPGEGRRAELPRWAAWDGSAAGRPTFVVLDTPAGGGIRMASEVVTEEQVIAEIEADARMPGPREKCERFAEMALFSAFYSRADYAARCPYYPLDGRR